MTKFEASTESIECGNKILETIYPRLLEFEQNRDQLSKTERETYNAMLGSQFALICEYYLKGLLIPNIQVEVPSELEEKITSLTEEQELMIIVADEEKIKADPILGKLEKKELRPLLNSHSLKNIGHSLICLLGTKTLDNNKKIHLPEHVRMNIVRSLKRKLMDSDAKTPEEQLKYKLHVGSRIPETDEREMLDYGDKIVEEEISNSSVSDAFTRGRYGIFDGFVSNVDWISELAFSIRDEIKHQYPNMIEVLKDKTDKFGKFIYPDSESIILADNGMGETIEYEMVPAVQWHDYGVEIFWNASRTIKNDEDKRITDILRKYGSNARVSNSKIYLENIESGNSFIISYVQDGQKKQIKLINGILYEILPEQINKDEIRDDNEER